jgi:lipopolysaccharide/colanic/teichoic acid biosynthesis glycosyltransferase
MIRLLDLIISIVVTILLSPISIIIIVINSIVTKGKPFFTQKRVGKEGRIFNLIKFRTMIDTDKNGMLITIGARDNRITPFGYILRKHKLDEIPQLLNVIKGEMSMVGPRPEVIKYVELYSEEQRIILKIKPGITDYASIVYYNESEILATSPDAEKKYIQELIPRKIELNMKYISDPSVMQYLSILRLTLKRFFFQITILLFFARLFLYSPPF